MLRPLAAYGHRVWVIASLLAVAVPALPCWGWLRQRAPRPGAARAHAVYIRIVAGAGAHGPARLPEALAGALVLGYLCVCVGCAVRLLLAVRATAILVRQSEAAGLTAFGCEAWAHCQERFASRAARLLATSRIAAPAAAGLGAPVILLPKRLLAEGSPQDLLAALAHESAHVERRDFPKNVLYELLTIPIAWHPAAWLLRGGITRTRELACDRLALDRMTAEPHLSTPGLQAFNAHAYARSLLRLASAAAQIPHRTRAVGILDGNILETRMMAMIQPRRSLSPVARRLLLTAAACLLGSVTTVSATYAFTPAASPASGAVYTPGPGITSPELIHSVDPSFPKGVHTARTFNGDSIIGATVDRDGRPQDVHVVRSLTPAFDAEAIKAIQKYRFRPGMKDGKPVAVAITIEVRFQRF